MKNLKNYKGVIIFLFILTVINFMPISKNEPTEYVKANNEVIENEVAINI